MKGTLFLLALCVSIVSHADQSEKNLTPSEKRLGIAVSDLQEIFVDHVYGFSFERKRPINTFAYPFTQRRFLFFLEETIFDYGNRNFLKRVESLYKDFEKTLRIHMDEETKALLAEKLWNYSFPGSHLKENRCPVFLLN